MDGDARRGRAQLDFERAALLRDQLGDPSVRRVAARPVGSPPPLPAVPGAEGGA
jgi:hypothetical protein